MSLETIYLDMDDVLVNFRCNWLRAYNEAFNDNLTDEHLTVWDLANVIKPECTDRWSCIRNGNFFFNLEPLEGAIESVKKLLGIFGSDRIYIASNSLEFAYEDKYRWIEKYLPELKNNIIFLSNKGKLFAKNSILVDDGPQNAIAFEKAGGYPIIYDAPYNRNIEGLRAKNWQEILQHISIAAYKLKHKQRRII